MQSKRCARCRRPFVRMHKTLCCGRNVCRSCVKHALLVGCSLCSYLPATDQKPARLPMSGSEPAFVSQPWGSRQGVRGSNCYDYSFDDFRVHRPVKTVPGDKAWHNAPTKLLMRDKATYAHCADVVPGILADNPGNVYREAAWNPCKRGFTKVQSFVGAGERGDVGDFHFYRQNKDLHYIAQKGDTPASLAEAFGLPLATVLRATSTTDAYSLLQPGQTIVIEAANLWSHKAGWASGALLSDSCGQVMQDPRKACRRHAVDYTQYCGSFCVRKGTKTSS